VALPEIFEEYFSALYESRTGILTDKAKAKARADAILERIVQQYGVKRHVLLKTVGPRFWQWIRDNKLPKPIEESGNDPPEYDA